MNLTTEEQLVVSHYVTPYLKEMNNNDSYKRDMVESLNVSAEVLTGLIEKFGA